MIPKITMLLRSCTARKKKKGRFGIVLDRPRRLQRRGMVVLLLWVGGE
jgi:hypothetical protein